MSTALWAVQVALVDALAGIPALAGAKVYNGRAPAKSLYPYITIGASSEGNAPALGRSGNRGTVQLHIWAQTNREDLVAIYGAAKASLDGVALPIAGHRQVAGVLRWITDFLDPDGRTLHAVLEYGYLTRAA